MGHVYEQQKDVSGKTIPPLIAFSLFLLSPPSFPSQYIRAKEAYERVITEKPYHAKVLQQLGWLHHQTDAPFQNQDLAIQYLTKSLEAGESLLFPQDPSIQSPDIDT